MRILHISDTHGCHHRLPDLPEADVIVHSGDFTMNGTGQEAVDFLKWFSGLDYADKIFIAGNHDCCMCGANIDGLDGNIHYLCNSGLELRGVKFFGIPMFIEACASGFRNKNYADIPVDTDVLITHEPPFGILDLDSGMNFGSRVLASMLSVVKPGLHLFGHIHSAHGIKNLYGTTFSNGSVMNTGYDDMSSANLIEYNNL